MTKVGSRKSFLNRSKAAGEVSPKATEGDREPVRDARRKTQGTGRKTEASPKAEVGRRKAEASRELDAVHRLIATVPDPEIPFLTIADLGILRSVDVDGDHVIVTITPTYSGCPAMDAIRSDISAGLSTNGYHPEIRMQLSPAWVTDDITPKGRRLLQEMGIAPPGSLDNALCPRCAKPGRIVSEFGSTACKALMVCSSCREPFDLFKELK